MEEDVAVIRARAQSLAHSTRKVMRDLVKMRNKHNLSQTQIAERLGVTQAAVSQLERQGANPTLDSIQRYALAAGARLEITVIDDLATASDARGGDSCPITFEAEVRSPRRAKTNWEAASVSSAIASAEVLSRV